MYHIAICDDDKRFIKYIKSIMFASGIEENLVTFYEYHSGEELIQSLSLDIDYDLLVLDMQMDKLDGNETAKLFREKYTSTTLIFCSGKVKPTVESFEVTPFRYLLKQYGDSRMLFEMKPIIERIKSNKREPYIVGSYLYNAVRLRPSEILYIAASKRGADIYICPNINRNGVEKYTRSNEKVKALYTVLKDYGFVYAHNSYIVNLNYIIRKTTSELELIDGTALTIARSKEKDLRKAFAINLAMKYK